MHTDTLGEYLKLANRLAAFRKSLCLSRLPGHYENMRGLVAQSRFWTVSTYRNEALRDSATLWALMVSCSMWTSVEWKPRWGSYSAS